MKPRKSTKTWQKTRKPNLLRHKSGRYYARAFAGGKEVWKSLKTSHYSVAQAKLAEFLSEHRERISNGTGEVGLFTARPHIRISVKRRKMKQILLTIALAVVAPFAYPQVAETTITESSGTMTVTNGNDSPQTVAKRYDFNGDGYPDYVLVKPTQGQSSPLFDFPPLATVIWYLRDNVRNGSAVGPTIRDNFGLVDAVDVNRDGNTDYVLFNPQTLKTKILFMSRNREVGSRPGPPVPNGFSLEKVGDLNGDGSPDWVLFNSSTRQTIIWYMRGTQILSQGSGPTLESGWELKAVADFDGDGHGDYLLVKLSGTSSPTEIWYIVNRHRDHRADGPAIPQGYRLLGAADFDKDGHPDYLLYQPRGQKKTAIWYMEDNVRVRAKLGPPINPDWTLGLP